MSLLLLPIAWIYGLLTACYHKLYNWGVFKSSSFDIPIISVGNLAVGGSGKTPITEYLIRTLQAQYNLGVLSRGYGRNTTGFKWVLANSNVAEVGDEALQVKSKFEQIPFAVCEKRVDGITLMLTDYPELDLIILDDAFQHRSIKPFVNLLLTRWSKPYFKDFMMPAGRLREYRSGSKRADAVIITKCPAQINKQRFEKAVDRPLFFSSEVYDDLLIANEVYGFSGLAHNKEFKHYLEENYGLMGFSSFRDHHKYSQSDIDEIIRKAAGNPIVCTEKDWVKVKELNQTSEFLVLSIRHQFTDDEFKRWLNHKLEQFES